MPKAIVLLSGGQDSTTCLYWAIDKYGKDNVSAVCIHYGQRHAAELDAARDIAAFAGVPITCLETSLFTQLGDSALVDKDQVITSDSGFGDSEAPRGLPTSFVPGRNMLMMAMAASVAVHEGATRIVSGVCQTDYSGYPDCRQDFVDAMAKAATLAMPSDSGPLHIDTPLMYLTKAETVTLAQKLGDACWEALGKSLTCYHGQRPGCGTCPSCVLREAGFREAGVEDPARVSEH